MYLSHHNTPSAAQLARKPLPVHTNFKGNQYKYQLLLILRDILVYSIIIVIIVIVVVVVVI